MKFAILPGIREVFLAEDIDLIYNEPVEFNLRVDYGLHSDIREFFENILH